MPTAAQLAFGAAWLAVLALLHYYLWRRLVWSTGLAPRWRRRITIGLATLGIGIPITLLVARTVSPAVARTIGWPVYLWLATGFLMITIFGLIDFARLAHRGVRAATRRPPDDPIDGDRRAFFSRVVGGGTALTAATFTGAGVYRALQPELVEVPIDLPRLPAHLDGFTIVQITDVHIGNTIGRPFIEAMVAEVNAAGGDLIVITGDLVDGRVDDLADAAAPLADLRAEHGVYFVTGNHEYYSGVDPWLAHLDSLGIRTLRNERVAIGGAGGFDLAGIDDHSAHRYPGHGADLARAVAGRDPDRELVLLAHQPRQVHVAREHGVGLQLSGHTHGGQIWPWHYLASAQQGGLLAGHSRHGDTQLYVSRGTGYWGPPVRVLAPAEITRVVLRSGQGAGSA